tara:strand:+ start:150 stop:524 length:375 start_codon:yes stop_codon:yes gene_type:complete
VFAYLIFILEPWALLKRQFVYQIRTTKKNEEEKNIKGNNLHRHSPELRELTQSSIEGKPRIKVVDRIENIFAPKLQNYEHGRRKVLPLEQAFRDQRPSQPLPFCSSVIYHPTLAEPAPSPSFYM